MYVFLDPQRKHGSIYVMNTPIKFKQSIQLLAIHFTANISNKSGANTVHKCYGKLTAFYVSCHVNSKLLTTYRLDLYKGPL